MPFDDILISPDKKNAIVDKAPDKMPLNPTAQGWTGQQVRAALSAATTGNVDSILSELETKLGVIKGHFESYTGNVSILSELPSDLTPYENTFIFIKTPQHIVSAVYFVSGGVAIETRFTANNNVIVSENQPTTPLNGDLWFDI